MTRKNLIIVLVAGLIIALVGFTLRYNRASPDQSGPATSTQPASFQKDYPKVSSDNLFKFVSAQEALEIFASGTGIVFLGFAECPWCQQLAPLVDEAAKLENQSRINYLDIKTIRDSDSDDYKQLVKILEPYLAKDESGQPRIYVPDVTFVKDGKIVSHYEAEKAEEGLTAEEFWTKDRQQRAIDQLRSSIRQLN